MDAPSLFEAIVLVFGTYRLVRLGGWDEFPLVAKIRAWVIGEHWVPDDQFLDDLRAEMLKPISEEEAARPAERLEYVVGRPKKPNELGLPGKQPTSQAEGVRAAYDRPTLAHLVHCPYCLGWWVSLAVYVAWLASPSGAVYALAPFALSGVVGLVSKNWDA